MLVNPNTPAAEEAAPGVPPEVLAQGITGPLAARVVAVLEQAVNPSIASHGGRADLVALNEEDGTAYLRLSGGCQGCAMSQMTLRQGIETTLLEEVPELTRVVDVTDHGSGENPFYSRHVTGRPGASATAMPRSAEPEPCGPSGSVALCCAS